MTGRSKRDCLFVGATRRPRATLLRETALQAVTALVFVSPALAQLAPTTRPVGGQVVAGSASIGQSTAQTTVNQASQRAAIDWKSFDVGSQHTVQFNQPNTSAVTLNRVTGPDPSQIAGQIIANGNIIITNPSGVFFHQGAQVNANSLIASAPGITTQNFMAGRMVFDQAPKPGAVVSNAGTITVKEAGLAALVAPRVVNSGVINARLGRVVLAGAEAHTIDLYGDGLVSIDVTKAVTQAPSGGAALVTNTGTVIADGGSVLITARAADGIVQDLVQAGGRIQANSVGGRAGQVMIAGVGGSVRVTGQVSADGVGGGAGGTVAVTASNRVTVANGARVTANGDAGGGTVALGTSAARARAGRVAALGNGRSPGTPAGTARQVLVEAGATVSADGTGRGSGGTVAVLSTQATQIDGLLSARGGPAAGSGGVVEASSDGLLMLNQAPDLSAAAGPGGTLYLDPYDLVIGTGTPTAELNESRGVGESDPPTTGTSYIAPATLEQASQNGAVTISLNASHDLTVQESVNLAQGTTSLGGASGGASLSLHAGNDLNVLANITLGNLDPNGNIPTLVLDAGHNLAIGPAVAIVTVGTINLTAIGPITDAGSASIMVGAGSTLSSQAGIGLQASNQITLGAGAQLTAGPALGLYDGSTPYLGMDFAAGTDITLGAGSVVQINTRPASLSGGTQFAAGGNITLGAGAQVTIGGASYLTLLAGDSSPSSNNVNAPAPSATAAIGLGAGAQFGGAGSLILNAAGPISLGDGSTVAGSAGGFINVSGSAVTAAGIISAQGGTLVLNASGAVTQPASGVIITNSLTGSASSFDLSGTGNQISQIGASFGDTLQASDGDVRVVSSVPLTVGNTAASTGGGIQVSDGHSITIVTDTLSIGVGAQPNPNSESYTQSTLYAPGGTISIQNLSANRAVELTPDVKTANTLSVRVTELANVTADRLQFGSGTAGPLSLGPGTVNLGSSVGGGIRQLDLISGGAISQQGGSALIVDTLTATGATIRLNSGANQIGNLAAQSQGEIAVANAQAVTVTGPITASTGNIVIDTSASAVGDVTLGAAITAQGGNVIVTAGRGVVVSSAGSVSAPNGTIQLDASYGGASTMGAVTVNGRLAAANLVLGAGSGGIALGADLVASGSLTLRGQGNADPAQTDLIRGTITQSAGVISAASLTARGTSVTLDGANQVAALGGAGSIATTGDFVFNDTSSLSVAAPLQANATLQLNVNGDLALGANLSAPMLSLAATGAITQPTGSITATALSSLTANSASLQGSNGIGTLGAFAVGTEFSLTTTGPLVVAGGGTAPRLTLTTGGSLQFGSDVTSTGSLTVNAAGTIGQTGGTLTIGTLSGTAVGRAAFGDGGIAAVGTLGAFSVTGSATPITARAVASGGNPSANQAVQSTLSLASSTPLTVTGPLSAATITLSAPDSLTLQGGQVSADNASVAVTSQRGGARLLQTGTTVVNSAGGATGVLTLSLPASGGTLSLQDLSAPGMVLNLALGSGTASGMLNVAGLQVTGTAGTATLSGSVGGLSDARAAALSGITPAASVAYELNGCTISLGSCGLVISPPPIPPVVTPPVAPIEPSLVLDTVASLLTPKGFIETTLGSRFKPDLFLTDLITIGIVRSPTDPELLLPNISDRDY